MTLDNIARAYIALDQLELARAVWLHALDLYRAQGRADEAEQVRRRLDEV